MSMMPLVTDNPQNNTENMLNLVFVKDKEVWVRYGGEDGQDCPLTSFCMRLCNEYSECLYSSLSFYENEDLDTIGDVLMDCSADGCPIGTIYFAMIQAAELRERLRLYENHGVMPDELERLKKCRHECKIDCLLERYDELRERLGENDGE